jgi:4a-hydroxytetrahydrobiopterin dehydratase
MTSLRARSLVGCRERGAAAVARLAGRSGSGDTTILRPIVLTRHTGSVAAPDDWNVVDDALERTFEFENFVEALAFVNRVGELAESENHHPDIAIHYNRVTLRGWTHPGGGITARDAELATLSGAL